MGWHHDPKEVDRIIGQWPHPVFGVTADNLLATEHRDVLMWKAEQTVLGRLLKAHDQTIGDCVSHGKTRAMKDLRFIAMALANMKMPDLIDYATEPTYAFSRVEVGGGRISGDGSTGAWGAEAVTKYGMLERKKYPSVDLTTYSGQLAKRWGSPRSGVPDELEPIARERIAKISSLIVTDDELMAAAYNWYPMSFCSNQGFTEQRDQWGFCDPRGSWAHCMAGRGLGLFRRGSNNVMAVPIQQSWGTKSPRGNTKATLATGEEVELPEGCFLVELDVVVSRMLRVRDSYVFGDLQDGYIERRPDFTV
jgi:hypothetical protein